MKGKPQSIRVAGRGMPGAGDCHKISIKFGIRGGYVLGIPESSQGAQLGNLQSSWSGDLDPEGCGCSVTLQLLTGILCSCKGNPAEIKPQLLFGFSQPQEAGKRGSAGLGQAGLKVTVAGQSLWG